MSETPNKEKPKSNVILGPWKAKSIKKVIVPEHNLFEAQQDLAFIEELSESVMVQMIYTLGENGIEINSKEFLQDIAFVIESLKSTLYREMGLPHPLTTIIRSISEISIETSATDKDKNTIATKFSIHKLNKLLETLDENDEPMA